ncbi:MAG: serine/threonine-protein kinase, partial [Planctomycetaceae bacterium]
VIAIHCIDETNGVPWFVMPLIAGPSLQESVKANGPLHEADITRIGLQIASGLAAAHSHGVVHRDIKPANILVDNHVNRVVITDFGLARQDSDTMITQAGVLAGTLHYMSPEQTRGEELDGRSDLFSLGALLYFLATGSVPFRSDTPVGALHKIANTPHSDVRRLNPEISKTLASAIDRLLEKDRADRFQSSSEVEQFFSSLIAHLNQPTQHAPPTVPSRRSPRVFRAVAGTVLAVIACSVFAFWYVNRPPTTNPAQPTKAVEPAPEELWASLQETHGIAAGFDTDFEELTRELRRLDTSIGEVTDQEETALDDEMNSTQSALRRLSQELEQ